MGHATNNDPGAVPPYLMRRERDKEARFIGYLVNGVGFLFVWVHLPASDADFPLPDNNHFRGERETVRHVSLDRHNDDEGVSRTSVYRIRRDQSDFRYTFLLEFREEKRKMTTYVGIRANVDEEKTGPQTEDATILVAAYSPQYCAGGFEGF
ncbi:hypothetical protein FPV67DRAFT_1460861 [Lyophyllum atratum]|nr:hypothetical protein FPV67DRAFT_1460861 [Lyophyllum atratum]